MKKKIKSGYWLDQQDDIAVVYPDGKVEVLDGWGEWSEGISSICEDGYCFEPREYISKL